MNDKKLKHLEFLQNVITRMNTNSFQIKTWTVTIVAALFALAAKDADIRYASIVFIVIPIFWVLDGFFISTERKYRDLYNDVRLLDESEVDFDMNTKKYKKGDRTWPAGIFSKTLIPLYGILIGAAFAVTCIMAVSNG